MPDFLLPDLGEGLAEAEIVTWRVSPGERVNVDQVVAEVETAKAVVEVPVPYAGVVAALHAPAGSTVSVGQPLLTVDADSQAGGLREPGVTVPEQAGGEEESGRVLIGYGTGSLAGSEPARGRRGRRRGPGGPGPAAPSGHGLPARDSAGQSPVTVTPAVPPASAGQRRPIAVISPLVRKQARDAGLDLATMTGTGPDGLISRGDVRRAIAELTTRQQAALASPDATAPATVGRATPYPAGTGERHVPLRGARRAMADRLSRSRREIPEATVWVDVDATDLVRTRRALNAADPARPVSLLALLARFTLLGLRRYPELNARVEQDEIVMTERVNLGFAAQTEHGLLVPVVRDAHLLTTRDLSSALAQRTAAARERKLTPQDLAGGTFTVNNYGVFGVDGSAAIINHPEVAILGMGRVIDRPWVVDGNLTVRKVTELTLAFDHRACDGGTAGGFLRYVADCVESPATALGDL